MSKKVLIISSSLRGGSNSECLARECERGAKDAGHDVQFISLKGKELKFCIGCLSCQETGKCVLKDDAADIMAAVYNAEVNDDVLFGENWNNQDIDVKTRSIITVVALMAQGITDSSLKFHLQNAKAHGVTQKEIAAIITHAAFYAGWPKGWAVFNLAKEVWEPGDVVNIPAGVKHWHGAAPDSWFSHLAVEVPGVEGFNEWLEPVGDDVYGKLTIN
jgi:hypothetical protein